MGKKTFYTERDIEDLAAQGMTSLPLNDDIVLTDLAREKAERLGITLVKEEARHRDCPLAAPTSALAARVKAAVLTRVGDSVPETLLDEIIARVLAQLDE
jgi:hypothetical protein